MTRRASPWRQATYEGFYDQLAGRISRVQPLGCPTPHLKRRMGVRALGRFRVASEPCLDIDLTGLQT